MDYLSELWEPLDESKNEIRVLLLKPSPQNDARLEGWLENKSLNQPLHFEAISYAWGGAQASIPLVLGFGDDAVEMPLTEHLGSALRSLRRPTATIAVWIDAICISQSDRAEREQQIGMLHHIFNRAAEVHVWLGKEPEGPLGNVSRDPAPEIQRSNETPLEQLMLASHSMYWSRLWVVGEMVLARDLTLHYGQKASSVRFLMQQLEQTESLSESSLPRFVRDLFGFRRVLPMSTGRSPDGKADLLLRVMNRARPRYVGDARDRVHAFIGLYNALFSDEMRADYSADLAAVYTAFAKRLIQSTNSLRILSHANNYHAVTPNLSSWVPDWASMYDHDADDAGSALWNRCHPCIDFRPVSFLDDFHGPCSLVVEGAIYQPVHAISKALERCASDATMHATINGWHEFAQNFPQAQRDAFSSILARTLPEDQRIQLLSSIVMPPHSPGPRTLRDFSEAVNVSRAKFAILYDKRLFFTSTGQIGLGPRHMRRDDVVALLAGANMPFLLRPLTERDLQRYVYKPQHPVGPSKGSRSGAALDKFPPPEELAARIEEARTTTRYVQKSQNPVDTSKSIRYSAAARKLPPPEELAARIEEARTTARILTQIVESSPQSNLLGDELVEEFAERAKLAYNSMWSYRNRLDYEPDRATDRRATANATQELSAALQKQIQAIWQARKALSMPDSTLEGAQWRRTDPLAQTHSREPDVAPPVYMVIGDCYVVDAMDGEALAGEEAPAIQKIRLI